MKQKKTQKTNRIVDLFRGLHGTCFFNGTFPVSCLWVSFWFCCHTYLTKNLRSCPWLVYFKFSLGYGYPHLLFAWKVMIMLNMIWPNLKFNVWRSFVNMATNLPSLFFIQFLELLLKFLVNFTLLKFVKSQRNYGLLITKELIFGFQILDLKDQFSALLNVLMCLYYR